MIRKLGTLALVAVCLLAFAAADPPTDDTKYIDMQKKTLELLWHIDQPFVVHPEIADVASSFDIKANLKLYKDQEAVTKFLDFYKCGMLPRGEIFSMYNEKHAEQVHALFDILYAAKDYDTLYKTAAWSRVNVNEYMFYQAFSIAILHREDTYTFHLPQPYEVFPHFFWNTEVMQKLRDHKMALDTHAHLTSDVPVIMANYSYWNYLNPRDPETKLAYFREDVGLKTFYSFWKQEFPFFLSSNESKVPASFRGEMYCTVHKQLTNRYDMERLANGMNYMEYINFNRPTITGYIPQYSYHNGVPFPQREEWNEVPSRKWNLVKKIQEFESRISAFVDWGKYPIVSSTTPEKKTESIYTREGINMLGNVLEGNAESENPHFFGSFDHLFRKILGNGWEHPEGFEVIPGALEQDMTCMGDPAFYRIYKQITHYCDQALKYSEPYTPEQLSFPGVVIESVASDKLLTYFERFIYNITDDVKVHGPHDAEGFFGLISQERLNYDKFNLHITVKAEQDTKGVIRMFMGPKYDVHGRELQIYDSYDKFYLFDYLHVNLKKGINKIERKSSDSAFISPQYVSSTDYYKQILESDKTKTPLPKKIKHYGFPENLFLVKGSPEGFPFRFFFIINKLVEDEQVKLNTHYTGDMDYDGRSINFPLNLKMNFKTFMQPNMLIKDVRIFHKEEHSNQN